MGPGVAGSKRSASAARVGLPGTETSVLAPVGARLRCWEVDLAGKLRPCEALATALLWVPGVAGNERSASAASVGLTGAETSMMALLGGGHDK